MANYSEVMDMNQKSMPGKGKGPKAELKSMTHERSANGGHIFTHEMAGHEGSWAPRETHTFGKEEGAEALAHFATHAGIPHEVPGEGEDKSTDRDIDRDAEEEEPEAEK